jgi:hypothetical protein
MSDNIGQLGAERTDPAFQVVVEHIADHDHAAARPLAHAAQIRMVELRHATAARYQSFEE